MSLAFFFFFGWDLGTELDNEMLPALEGSVFLALGFMSPQIRAEHLPENQRFQTREWTLKDVISSGLRAC